MRTSHVVLLGLVNWLATLVLVEGVIFAGLRHRIELWSRRGAPGGIEGLAQRTMAYLHAAFTGRPIQRTWREKVAYLVNCHLCTGLWVGLVIGLVAGGPFDVPLVGWVLAGLTYKAIGHLVLEVVAVLRHLARFEPATPVTINQHHHGLDEVRRRSDGIDAMRYVMDQRRATRDFTGEG